MSDFKKYVIHVSSNKLSYESALNTINSAKNVGKIDVELWDGYHKNEGKELLEKYNFKLLDYDAHWTKWQLLDPALSCFFSHYSLWEHCIELNKRIMILEHDTIFKKKYIDYEFEGVVNIGEPLWDETPKKIDFNENWGEIIKKRKMKKKGFSIRECECTDKVFEYQGCHCQEYFLHGAHSYVITPNVAKKLIEKSKVKGILPADIHINRENIEIADYLPYCAYQNQTFSLIQNERYLLYKGGRLPRGKEAWDEL